MHVVTILPNTAPRYRLSTIFLPSRVLGNEASTLPPLSPLYLARPTTVSKHQLAAIPQNCGATFLSMLNCMNYYRQ